MKAVAADTGRPYAWIALFPRQSLAAFDAEVSLQGTAIYSKVIREITGKRFSTGRASWDQIPGRLLAVH
jgi:hypothetical protein